MQRAVLLAGALPVILKAEHAVWIEDAVLRIRIDEGGTFGEQYGKIEAPPLRMHFGHHVFFVLVAVSADAARASCILSAMTRKRNCERR
ncbi:MAG: hypothetical protein VCD31_11110 [Alphaproteobacteria bacterium]